MLLSSVAVKLIGALFKIPLASPGVLGDLGFGYFSAAYDLYLPVYTVALSGFSVAISRTVADYNAQNNPKAVRRIFAISVKSLLCLGLFGSILLVALSKPLVSLSGGAGGSVYSLLAIAPSVLFCSVISVFRGYFEGLKNMIPTAVSNIIEALCKLCLGLAFAVAVMKTTGNPALAAAAAMAGITLSSLLAFLYLLFSFKKSNSLEPKIKLFEERFNKKAFASVFCLVIPFALASLSVSITSLIDSLTLRRQLLSILRENPQNAALMLGNTDYSGLSLEEIPTVIYGIKSKAQTLFNLAPTFTTALGVGALPMITECFVRQEREDLRDNINRLLKLSSVIALPVAFGFLSVGQGVMELLYSGNSAALGGKILSLYGIAAFFGGITVPTTAVLQAVKAQKKALYNILAGIAVKLACNILLTPIAALNVFGTVLGTLLCFVTVFTLNIISVIRGLNFVPDFKSSILKPFVCAFFCGAVAFAASKWLNGNAGTVLAIFAGGAVYLALLWIFRVITKNELEEIIKK